MMSGRLYIDGQDVYKQFGMYVTENGYNELIAMPPLKSVTSNDWQEEDGIEADLSAPVLNNREVAVRFAIPGIFSRYLAFIEFLSDGAYHKFNFARIKRTFTLRLVSSSNADLAKMFGFVTLKFADDFPMKDYEYKAPDSSMSTVNDYTIDGESFTVYGVRILQGSLTEVQKLPSVKTNLLRNLKSSNGAIYDAKNVTYKSKDVKLYCLMRANTLDELWRNYDALLYDLIRPNERLLWVDELDKEFPCHYKSCSVQEFYPEDKIWLKFTITLVFTSFRFDGEEFILSTEDNQVIITEQNDNSIDLSIYGT
ncbi:hypothetical protein [Bacteroides sp.]|uniref:hypothetical protein n=1 Tax=Bacteroides sp. TaxID=29523 RepID=UPI002A801ECE|nr:hypothetical protein [Bacteroides sp.]